MRKTFQIKVALVEEAMDSWVWTNDYSIESNRFIIIKNKKNGKSIKTFKRSIDDNFIKNYNDRHGTISINSNDTDPYLVISEYYRNLLDISKNSKVELEVSNANFLQKHLKIHWTHPNPSVQFANRAGATSVIVGIIALLLTVYSIWITIKSSC